MPQPVAAQGGPLGVSRPPAGSGRLNYAQLKQVWIQNGGNPKWAPTMAVTALLESGGNYGPTEINDNPSSGDLSAGLWQINYFGALGPGRTQQYGPIQTVASDPNANARAAITLLGANGGGIGNWPHTGGVAVANNGGRPLTDAGAMKLGAGTAAGPAIGIGATGTPGAPSATASSGGGGCAGKGQAFKLSLPVVGGPGLTWCQVKALTGGFIMVSGIGLMVFGVAAIIVAAGLGGKAPGAAKIAPIPKSAASEGSKIPETSIDGTPSSTPRERSFASAQARGRANAREAGPFPG